MRKFVVTTIFILLTQVGFAGPIDNQIEMILEEYFKIQSSLAQDTTEGIDTAAKAIAHHTHQAKVSDPELGDLLSGIQKAAHQIQGKEIKAARDEFFNLSKPLLIYLNKFYSGEKVNFRFFCSMANKGWIQSEKDTKNPYYGKSMLDCGELIK